MFKFSTDIGPPADVQTNVCLVVQRVWIATTVLKFGAKLRLLCTFEKSNPLNFLKVFLFLEALKEEKLFAF